MIGFLLAWLIAVLLMFLVSAMSPVRPRLSRFELERRAAGGKGGDKLALRRYQSAPYVEALRRLIILVLMIPMTLFGVACFGMAWGVILAFIVIMVSGIVPRLTILRRLGRRLYERIETRVLRFVTMSRSALDLLTHTEIDKSQGIASREELVHVIESTPDSISDTERQRLLASLRFGDLHVADVMTKRDDVVSISHSELLGPLVLDDLHRSGHSFFPVIDGDIDHVVGLLDTSRHLSLDAKRSVTVRTAMSPDVETISPGAQLQTALDRLIASHQHLLLVVDDGRTAGLITLADATRRLFEPV